MRPRPPRRPCRKGFTLLDGQRGIMWCCVAVRAGPSHPSGTPDPRHTNLIRDAANATIRRRSQPWRQRSMFVVPYVRSR